MAASSLPGRVLRSGGRAGSSSTSSLTTGRRLAALASRTPCLALSRVSEGFTGKIAHLFMCLRLRLRLLVGIVLLNRVILAPPTQKSKRKLGAVPEAVCNATSQLIAPAADVG